MPSRVSFADLAHDLERAIQDHRMTFGSSKVDVKRKQKVIQIMLWDRRLDILRALQAAAKKNA